MKGTGAHEIDHCWNKSFGDIEKKEVGECGKNTGMMINDNNICNLLASS